MPSRCPGLDPDLLRRGSSDRRSQAPSHPGVDEGASPHFSELDFTVALSTVTRLTGKYQLGNELQVTLTVILERLQDTSLFSSKDGDSEIFMQKVSSSLSGSVFEFS